MSIEFNFVQAAPAAFNTRGFHNFKKYSPEFTAIPFSAKGSIRTKQQWKESLMEICKRFDESLETRFGRQMQHVAP